MNTVLAQSLLSVLLPAADTPKAKLALWEGPHKNSLGQIVDKLAADPAYKLLSLKTIPTCDAKVSAFNADLWEGMLHRIKQMHVTHSSEHRVNWTSQTPGIKTIAALAVLRGDKIYEESPNLEAAVFSKGFFTQKVPATSLVSVRDSHRLFGNEKSVALLANSQAHC